MRIRLRIIMFMIGAVVLAVPARGQGPAPPALASQYVDERAGVGLDTAIARAREREPSLRAVRADIEVAQGLRQQAGLRPNPTLTFERRGEPGGTDNLTSIGIQWPLDLFRRDGRVQTAERGLQATQLAVADRERLLIADVRVQDPASPRLLFGMYLSRTNSWPPLSSSGTLSVLASRPAERRHSNGISWRWRSVVSKPDDF